MVQIDVHSDSISEEVVLPIIESFIESGQSSLRHICCQSIGGRVRARICVHFCAGMMISCIDSVLSASNAAEE